MSTIPEPPLATWTKSSYSGNGGANCVEWIPTCVESSAVPIRDSKNPDGPALLVATAAWTSFLAGIKNARLVAD
ncbi:DUF397 domain-containing protein [Streptomyces olivoreticuli]|uniref:DUF397 domain-containing protein n=1 Tax=Streptomyces olivoreticuli TaxID=68246 RepID=UPI00265929E1|nr:DUF397 domain-containing protein [Streptomyces olivoreticuli]WKK26696.1 DUF397 domain-containing protein [Streptomyces olivoreticuli]